MSIDRLRLERAYSRTEGYRTFTPLRSVPFLNERWKAEVFVKCEQFQPIGAFKIRGAANFALQLSEKEREPGLVTHSSGNHAQAVAYMAHKLGTKAWIVMPDNSNQRKIKNAEKWGAEITLCKPTVESREETANSILEEKGAVLIPPYDHEWIVEGQATAAMEVYSEISDVDLFVAPLGGGGLLAGSALATKEWSPSTQVIGAEPRNARDGYIGFKQGERQTSVDANTIADGLRTTVGVVPFDIIQKSVNDIWLAKEEHIIPWMYRFWQEMHLLIEPSCAVPFVALDERKEELEGKRIVIVITGGNVDVAQLPSFAALS